MYSLVSVQIMQFPVAHYRCQSLRISPLLGGRQHVRGMGFYHVILNIFYIQWKKNSICIKFILLIIACNISSECPDLFDISCLIWLIIQYW